MPGTSFGSWRSFEDDDDITEVDRIAGEWDKYLKEKRVKDTEGFSLRGWWLANEGRFPILCKVALDLMAVPAMSTEVERVFSG